MEDRAIDCPSLRPRLLRPLKQVTTATEEHFVRFERERSDDGGSGEEMHSANVVKAFGSFWFDGDFFKTLLLLTCSTSRLLWPRVVEH
jgi:hypothetical protein